MNDYEALVLQLDAPGDTPEKHATIVALREAVEDAKPALLAGLDHPAWRVRHGCLVVLDHTDVDEETLARTVRALSDPHRKVRRAAMHLLGCARCKPEGFTGIEGVDLEGIYLSAAASDRSRRVRYTAMGKFMFRRQPLEPRVASTMRAVIDEHGDDELRTRAAKVLAFPEVWANAQTSNERREQFERRVDAFLSTQATTN
jgi:hypothetical protein